MLNQINQRLTSLVRNFPRFDWSSQRKLRPLRDRSDGVKAVLLARSKDFDDALWSAYSAFVFVNGIKNIQFMFDGELSFKQRNRLRTVFPDAILSDVREIALDFQNKTPCSSRVAKRLLAPKLFSILELSSNESILYLDSDVLFFELAIELDRAIGRNSGRILSDSGDWCQDLELLERSACLNLRCFRDANSGLMYIPKSSFSNGLFESLYETSLQSNSRFFEQTTFGVLAASCSFLQLPEKQYVVDAKGMFLWDSDLDYENVVCRHFTGVVRHRLRMKGVPLLISKLKGEGCFVK